MSSAYDLIKVAASQIGYKSSSTKSKYNSWYGMEGFWCAMFVSWCAAESGNSSVIPKHSYTPSGAQWFKNKGQWTQGTSNMRAGDIVYFDFPGKPDRISHVGIFEKYAGNYIQCIEGNTGDPGGRSGGCVARKQRKPAHVVGYGRPKYDSQSSSTATQPAQSGALEVDGIWGADTTKALQKRMGTPIDGIISGQSHKPSVCISWVIESGGSTCIEGLQRMLGVTVDGDCGEETIKALQKYLGVSVDGEIGKETVKALQRWLNS